MVTKMRFFRACLVVVLAAAIALSAQGQSADVGAVTRAPARATVEGLVTRDPGSEPVKKALIELIAENQSVGQNYTAVTGADGTFRIEGIVPGSYRLLAERTGFVEVEKHRPLSEGRMITLAAGQELKDVAILFQPTAAIAGRVTDEDGDPLADAQVAVLRQTFAAGHSRWEQTGAERTNDLGEYRIPGLATGTYYLSITPPPNFKSLIEAAGNAGASAVQDGRTSEEQCRLHTGEACDASKAVISSYTTTYYPGVRDRAQAALIQLRAGEDFPANFSLTPSPSVSLRGSVENIPVGASAIVMLRAPEFNSILNGGEVRKDGSFEIRDVSPGSYTILATVNGATPHGLMARQAIEVGGENLNGLHVALQAGSEVQGRLRLEDKVASAKFDFHDFFLALRSADGDDDMASALSLGGGFSNPVQVTAEGNFQWKSVPPGRYFVVLVAAGEGLPNCFVKSAVAGGRDALDAGVMVNGGILALDLVASDNGAVIEGLVTNHKGEAIGNATVVLIPEQRFRLRPDRYGKAVSDQSGRFALHGISPGTYTLLAWESIDGDEYYNPEFLKTYEGQGRALHLAEGEHSSVQVEAIPEEQR